MRFCLNRFSKQLILGLVIPGVLGLQGCAPVIIAGTAAAGMMIAQDRRTTGTIVDDNSIELKTMQAIRQALGEDERQAHVSVLSYNNRVLLIGQASTEAIKRKIESTARQAAKVKQLHNEIEITAPTSLVVRSNDSITTAKIKSAMVLNREINPTRIKVITENGIVYLLGIVTPHEEEVAVNIARHSKGVKKVVKIFEYQSQ